MEYQLDKALEILERTPQILKVYLKDLSKDWTSPNEGEDTWSTYDVLGHLIHGEQTDWIARLKIILSNESDKTFIPFDRFAQFENSKGKTLQQLLNEFTELRAENLKYLKSCELINLDLDKKAIHPDLGEVKLKELLATWVVHDLGHISQITRVMAKQYHDEVGPWKAYLTILNK